MNALQDSAAPEQREAAPAGGNGPRRAPHASRAAVAAAAALFLFTGAATLAAEPVPTVTVETSSTVTNDGSGEWAVIGTGSGELSLTTEPNPNTRGELTVKLTAAAGERVESSLTRAWVRARFPWLGERSFHVTAGKAPLTWGEGLYYNAGDVVFGTTLASTDLVGAVERDNADWLVHAFLPTGSFSFIEPVIVIPLPDAAALQSDATAYPQLSDSAGGLRFQGRISGLEVESGYLVDGRNSEHRPYISVQGHLGADLYAAASTGIPHDLYVGSSDARSTAADSARDRLTVSGGTLYTHGLPGTQQLSARLESVIRPYAAWSENAAAESYALELYPELIWSLSPNFTLYARSVISPIDGSALLSPGVSWNLYNGLSLQLFAAAQVGDENDSFGYDRFGGAAVTAVARYIY